jgi:diguanylate cyclase (GGDEF)-like protein
LGATLYGLLLAVFAGYRRRLDRVAEAELELSRAQARTDDLTGLANRRHLYLAMEQALADEGAHEHLAAVLLIDIDRFKEINDTLGHHVGDDLLRKIASRLERALPEAAVLARLGGDEFVALLETPRSIGAVTAAAERFLATSTSPLPWTGSSRTCARAWASRSAPAMAPTARRCFATPTPRCTGPREARATCRCTQATPSGSASTGCAWRSSCAVPSMRTS